MYVACLTLVRWRVNVCLSQMTCQCMSLPMYVSLVSTHVALLWNEEIIHPLEWELKIDSRRQNDVSTHVCETCVDTRDIHWLVIFSTWVDFDDVITHALEWKCESWKSHLTNMDLERINWQHCISQIWFTRWRIHLSNVTHSNVPWLTHTCDMMHWLVWHDSCIRVTWCMLCLAWQQAYNK